MYGSIPSQDIKTKILLDYILQHVENDQRPYLEVDILGCRMLGLLDSGASCTIVGGPGWSLLEKLGLKLYPSNISCTVANGEVCQGLGTLMMPVALMKKLILIKVLVVPALSHQLILGADFFREMAVVPDLRRDEWYFGKDNVIPQMCGISDITELAAEQQHRLKTFLNEQFGRMGDSLGVTNLVEHEILTDAKPIKQRYYPVSPVRQKMLEAEVKKMLEDDVIEPSKSPWSSPVILVPKKDGTQRFCVDYRQLNAVTKKDAYPLPYVSAILDRLRDARYISSIDIKSAYWQVPIAENSRERTAFTVPGMGLFQFKRMPYGLTNAPATFQRLIDTVLGADLEDSCFVYLDDVIIISKDFESHLELLRKVLERLMSAGFTLNREKCNFCRPEITYLGYVVDRHGLHVDPRKVEAILNVPTPRNVKEVRSFVGMASWYRRFVPNFATTIAPLCALTKKNRKFNFTEECEHAFNAVKQHLVSAPILACPDFERPFALQTDASAYGIGAVLTQPGEDGEKVIAFLSRSLTRQERAYTTTERECLAVIWAMEKLRPYLDGIKFTVITDHYSLLWLDRLKNPTGRLARWAVRMQGFDFAIVHRKGKDHVVPDFLSRSVPVLDAIEIDNDVSDSENIRDRWYNKMVRVIADRPDRYPAWRVENGKLLKYVRAKIPELREGTNDWRIVVPKERRRSLLSSCHDNVTAGHLGINKTYWKLQERYYWPKMLSDVANYVRNCKVCAQHKVEQKAPAGHMGDRPKIDHPWQTISLDFIGPFPRSPRGYRFAIVVTDYFSKYVLIFPVRTATAAVLTRYVENDVFLVYGVPKNIICDNGVQMKSAIFGKMCEKYGTKILFNAHYYPRANPTERTNRTIKTMISSYITKNHKTWDENLAAIACAIRTAKHEVIGYTPFFVNFGRNYIGSGRAHEEVNRSEIDFSDSVNNRIMGFQKMFADIQRKLQLAHERSKNNYNLRRREVRYEVGQYVWRRNKVLSDATKNFSAKLAPKYVGPFRIRKRIGYLTYELVDGDRSVGNWHVQDLKPYLGDDPPREPPE